MVFKKTLLSFALATALMQPALAQTISYNTALPNGISSGDTTQTSTVLWARSAATGNIRFQVKDETTAIVFEQIVTVTDAMVPAKVGVSGLIAGKQYTYIATLPNGTSLTGSFKTAAADNTNPPLSFGVTGDWRGELAPYPSIKNVIGKNLDFFIKLGDTIYADYPTAAVPAAQAQSLSDYQKKHEEVYAAHSGLNTLADLQKSVSIFSMIDDHEVTNDFAGGALASSDARFNETTGLINQTTLYSNGLQAFTQYNAIANKRYAAIGDSLFDNRPDLYRSQRYGSTASIFIPDARSFRDAELTGVTDITDSVQIGGFLAQAFDYTTPTKTRTLLGKQQLDRLKADLLAAQTDNVVWKFVAMPEPIQNLGVLAASDRYEGYASERSELLRFIDENAINNVVFVTTDIHGTIINDLTYQRREDVLSALASTGNPLSAPQIKTSAFEISTGSVAFDPSFGNSILDLLNIVPNGSALLAQLFAGVGVADRASFDSLPMTVKNAAMQSLMDSTLTPLGYTPIGLQDNNRINAKLVKGSNTALFSFGWSKFDINPKTNALTITTYGIDPYTAQNLADNSAEVKSRKPEILSRLQVIPQPQPASVVKVKLIAINDFHGQLESPGTLRIGPTAASSPNKAVGGIDWLAGYIANIKSKNPNTAVVSAGDLIGATPLISALFHDEGTIETMNRAGLDINAVGNHEFDEGKTELLRMQNGGCHPTDVNSCQGATVGTPVPFEGAKFTFLAANVVDKATKTTLFPATTIKTYDGVKVGFIGLTLKETPTIVTPTGVAGLDFKDEVTTINAATSKLLAQGAKTIVVLIHQGGTTTTTQSVLTVNSCDGGLTGSPIKTIVNKLNDAVSLVISGHTHNAYNCMIATKSGKHFVPVTSASSQGRLLTEIDLTIGATSGKVSGINARNIPVDRTNAAITPDASIKTIVDQYKSLVAPIANTVIGNINATLSRANNSAGESVLGDIIADSQWNATKASGFGDSVVAFMNPGGVRADLTYASSAVGEGDGKVTFGEAFTVQPFGNSLVTLTLTGAQIETMLEQQFTGCTNAQPFNRILSPSTGFNYAWNSAGAACDKVDPASIKINGVVVDPAANYRVTVNNFLADGGDNFKVLAEGTNRLGGAQDIDALKAYFIANPVVSAGAQDRIQLLP